MPDKSDAITASGAAGTGTVRPKRLTMRDVADHVGVSRQLVSLILRNQPGPSTETREKVLAAARELGYHPDGAAQLLRRNRSGVLGVLFVADHPFDLALVENMYPAVEEFGYSIALGAIAPTHDEARAVEEMLSYRAEALVLIGPELAPEELGRLADRLPVVEVGRFRRTPGVDAVFSDGHKGTHLAVEHLVELGHEQIAHVDGGDMPGAADRRQGYVDTMTAHGLEKQIDVLAGDYSERSGHAAANELLARPTLPTAIVAANDRSAVGVLGTLVRAGIRVPNEVSVTGFDDDRTSRLPFIDLTTVSQDATDMAYSALRAISERLEGRTEDREFVSDPSLVVRSSTADPRR